MYLKMCEKFAALIFKLLAIVVNGLQMWMLRGKGLFMTAESGEIR
jgi:hypothetical protein